MMLELRSYSLIRERCDVFKFFRLIHFEKIKITKAGKLERVVPSMNKTVQNVRIS